MKKTAFLIMFVTVASKILGFVRDIALSYFYGASTTSDVFILSQSIPNTLFSLIGTAVMLGFIPIYSRLFEERSEEDADRFTNAMLTWVLLLAIAVTALGFLFARPLVRLFAIGFDEAAIEMAVTFTRIMLFGLLANAVLYVLRGYLQVRERYVITTMLGFPYNIVLILGIALSAKFDLMILPIAALVALTAQIVIFIPDMRKLKFRIRPTVYFEKEILKDFLRLTVPIAIASIVTQIAMIMDRTLASSVAVGGISALNYANRLNGFVLGLFITSIITVLYPMMAKMAASGDSESMKRSVTDSILLTSVFVIPVSIGAALLAHPIVSLLFGRGAFDEVALQMTSAALVAYSIGMLPNGLREILSKALYALKDTKTPMINGALTSALQIALCLALYRPFGIAGIAFAASIAAILSTAGYIVSLRKKIGYKLERARVITIIKLLIASLLMAVVAYFGFRWLSVRTSEFIALAVSVSGAALVYAVSLLTLRVEEATQFASMVRAKFRKKRV